MQAYTRDDTTKLADGKLETIDNQIDQTTGTFKLKAVFQQCGAGEPVCECADAVGHKEGCGAVETVVKHTPWDTWPFFLAFVGVVSAERYLRKKWGVPGSYHSACLTIPPTSRQYAS